MEIKKGEYYKIHGNIIVEYIEIDDVYKIKGLFGYKDMVSVIERPSLYPRIYKLSYIKNKIISKIDKKEYDKYKNI